MSAGTLTPHHTVMEQSFVQSADTLNGHRKRIREAVRITGLVLTSVGITGLVLRSVRIAARVVTAVGIVTCVLSSVKITGPVRSVSESQV